MSNLPPSVTHYDIEYNQPPSDLLTTAQVAEMHDVSRRAVLFWIQNGQIRAWRFGKAWLIAREDACKFARRSPGRPPVK